MFYRVLHYSPTPTGDATAPCLVVIVANLPGEARELLIYVARHWTDMVAPQHHEYLQRLTHDWITHDGFIDRVGEFKALEEQSVGPLRLGASGTCSRAERRTLLESVFGPSGYYDVGRR